MYRNFPEALLHWKVALEVVRVDEGIKYIIVCTLLSHAYVMFDWGVRLVKSPSLKPKGCVVWQLGGIKTALSHISCLIGG